jgi:hypothetical protein
MFFIWELRAEYRAGPGQWNHGPTQFSIRVRSCPFVVVPAESKAGTSFKRSVPAVPEFQIRTPADSGWTVFAASNYV